MFSKSLNDFFKNPKIVIPNVLFSLICFTFSKEITNNQNLHLLKNIKIYSDIQSIMNIIGSTLIYFSFFLIFAIFASPLILSWTSVMIKKVINNEDANLGEDLKSSFQYYFRMLCINVLQGLIIIVLLTFWILTIFLMVIRLQNTNNLSYIKYFNLILILFLILFIFVLIFIVPIQIVLIYDNVSITKSFSKGFKFGFKKFFPILGSTLLIAILTSIFNLIFKKYEILSIIITSYIGVFLPVYIMNLYKCIKDNEIKCINIIEDGSNVQRQDEPIINENKTSDENKFII